MHGVESKIFIGSKDKALKKRIKILLQQQGHMIIGEAEDGTTSLRIIRRVSPDLVIVDKDLPGISGMELTKIIEEDKIAPVILLTSTWEQHFFIKAQNSWVFAFLVKPIQEGHLLATASFAINAFQRMVTLENQVEELKETLESRKVIDRAKGILMKQMGLSENESYRLIQQQSMDKCLSMKKIADTIILTHNSKLIKK